MADLARWGPLDELANLRDEVNRLFSNVMRAQQGGVWGGYLGWQPAVDIYQTDEDVVVNAELPGLSEDEVSVTATEDSLTISGEIRREAETKRENYLRRERRWGSFNRTVGLPAEVDPARAKASFKNGLLEVRLPKTERARSRPVKIDIH